MKGAETKASEKGSGVRVLVATPDRITRQVLSFVLSDDKRFSAVREAATAADAIAAALDADAVLLDIMFPDDDGFSALAAIKAQHPDTVVVMYSPFDPPYLRAMAEADGADAYVCRVAGTDALLSALACADC